MSVRTRLGLAFAILLLAATGAHALEPIVVTLEFEPSLEDGRRSFDICARCHLPEAWGNDDGTYPQLAGQHVNVLMKQLLDIRSGRRANPAMQPFVQQRTIGGYQDLANVVAYISTLPMNPQHAKGPWPPGSPEHDAGKAVYTTYCQSCHGAGGEGDNARAYPRLQGQHYSYMARQARLARNNLRRVDASMSALFTAVSPTDFDRALNYVTHLPIPAQDLAPNADWRNPDFQ